jgi:hypothetical protein
MSGPTSGLQGHGVQPRSLDETGEKLSPSQVQQPPTPEQQRYWETREAVKKQWSGPGWLERVGTVAEQEQDRRDAVDREEQALRAKWPDPRQALRTAHQALAAARGDLQHRREIAQRAADHLAVTRSAHREATDIQATVDAQAVERLKERIGTGGPVPAAEVSVTDDRTTRDLELAERAHSELVAAVTEAEKAEQGAVRAVADAAQAVIIGRGLQIATEISEAEAALADKRGTILGIDRVWHNGRAIRLPGRVVSVMGGRIMAGDGSWERVYRALLDDPESPLP